MKTDTHPELDNVVYAHTLVWMALVITVFQ